MKPLKQLKGAVPLEIAALNRRSRSYAMYLFLVFCSMYAYFVVAVETDSSYKPSFKKKDRPGTEKQRYEPYGYSVKFRGIRCSTMSIFFPSDSIQASTQRYNAIFFILVIVFHLKKKLFKYFYIIFL